MASVAQAQVRGCLCWHTCQSLVTRSSSNIQVSYKNSNEGEDGVQAQTFVVSGCERVNFLAKVKQSKPALIGS